MVAVLRSDVFYVRYLLEEVGCEDIINARENLDGWTALHYAIYYSTPEILELLLKHGADPNIESDCLKTPLHVTAERGKTEFAQLLHAYGANLSVVNGAVVREGRGCGWSAMHFAARRGRASFVQWLLLIGVEDLMLTKDCVGKTPLDWAIQHKNHSVVDVLLQGYRDKILAQEGIFGLHWILRTAVNEHGKIHLPVGTLQVEQIVMLLTLFAPPISTEDGTGALPLHIACRKSNTPIEVIQFLVDQDPTSVLHEDSLGDLPIHKLCASQPQLHTVQYLHGKHQASVRMTNHDGCVPFMVASLSLASLDVVWYLMVADPAAALASVRHASTPEVDRNHGSADLPSADENN